MISLAQTRIGRFIVGFLFAYMSFAIPVHRLRETSTLVAFHHPRPSYPLHILLVPKKALSGLHQLSAVDGDFFVDPFATVQGLVKEFDLQSAGYRLIANGGRYQEIPQLHFHLVSGSDEEAPASTPY